MAQTEGNNMANPTLRHLMMPALALLLTSMRANTTRADDFLFVEAGPLLSVVDNDDAQFGGGVTAMVGVGGRLNGSWLRFFAISEIALTTVSLSSSAASSLSAADIGVGGRVIAPLGTRYLRLFVDAQFAALIQQGSFDQYEWTLTRPGARLGVGLQLRPVKELSIQLRVNWSIPLDDAPAAVPANDSWDLRTDAILALTWHI
ncbi:MAG: hypothetical protein KC561_02700 [Myxococcales bacterium]|nr:hypothetical protein [Myxococcales bacterium]